MKKILFLVVLLITFISCQKKSETANSSTSVGKSTSNNQDNFDDLKKKKDSGCEDKKENNVKEFKLQGGDSSGCDSK